MNSTILNCSGINQLKELCQLNSNWKLLYRTKNNGFQIKDFYAKCKGHSPTLMIIKTTENYVFGGYTKANWTCDGNYVADESAFIFSLINKWNKPQFMEVKDSNKAINCDIDYNLSFGNDIFIHDSSKTTVYSYSNLGKNYKYNDDVDVEYQPYYNLAGSHRFQVKEIEVFKEMK